MTYQPGDAVVTGREDTWPAGVPEIVEDEVVRFRFPRGTPSPLHAVVANFADRVAISDTVGRLARSLTNGARCAFAYRMGLAHAEFEAARRPPPGGY